MTVYVAPIEIQQLAEARARLAAPPMAAAGLVFGHEAGHLQRFFQKGVAEGHIVITSGQLMEVADVESVVPVAVEREQALDLGDGRPLGRRRSLAATEEVIIALEFELPAQAPDTAGAAPQDGGGLGSGEFAGQGAHNDFLRLHDTLHSAGRKGHGHLLDAHSFHTTRQERPFHDSRSGGSSRISYTTTSAS